MPELIRLLLGTVKLRPYVFTFLAAYLFLAVTTIGWRRALLYSVTAYLIAFLCEWSSVRNGFPFGLYHYIANTTDQELWIAGVPFMDSLSFTFLSYVSYEMAVLLRSPLRVGGWDVQIEGDGGARHSWGTLVLAGLLMMYLDIIIDPVALQGERWFLGKIYYYPGGGSYFGVTIANFLGWFFVCVAILRIYLWLETLLRSYLVGSAGVINYRFKAFGPVALYFGILIFNLSVTFYIGEVTQGWAGVFITLLLALLLVNHIWHSSRYSAFGEGSRE